MMLAVETNLFPRPSALRCEVVDSSKVLGDRRDRPQIIEAEAQLPVGAVAPEVQQTALAGDGHGRARCGAAGSRD